MDSKEKLLAELKASIESLETISPDTEEYSIAAENIAKLYKLKLEEDKLKIESDKTEKEFKERVKDRLVHIGIGAAQIVVPGVIYCVLMNKGFKFEETGCVTSSFFRGIINKIRPDKI